MPKTLEVNGLKITIYKMDVFRQNQICNQYLFPLMKDLKIPTAEVSDTFKFGIEIIQSLVTAITETLSAKEREQLLFDVILDPDYVKCGVERLDPFIFKSETGKYIIPKEIEDVSQLYKVAFEVMRFNFENFFLSALNTEAPSKHRKTKTSEA